MTDRPASLGHSDGPAEVYDRITDPTFALDGSWRVTYYNERAAKVLGEGEESLLGRKFWAVAPDDIGSAVRDEYERAAATQEPATFEAFHGPLDTRFEVRAYLSEAGLTVSLRDVTERVDRKRRLEKRERALRSAYEVIAAPNRSFSEQIDDLLGVVRETIGTDYATLSRVDENADEYVFEAVSTPEGADLPAGDTTSLQTTNCERVVGTERMYDLIEGLLEYARVETRGDPFEPVDLEAVLDDVLADLQLRIESSGSEITVEDLPTVEGDASQLRQLFQNLLENAVQYSGDEPPRVRVGTERRGDEWVVSVADEDIGIDSDNGDRVFEVFRRLHTREEYEGTGIGLALCKRVVERHGGDIWVDLEPGEGSTFSFTLPAPE